MVYIPTDWHNGDIVTDTKLNKLEEGVYTLSNTKGTTDTLIDSATPSDAGKILSINEEGKAVLVSGASMYGSPLSANNIADMTDTTRIYVYSGESSGNYTKGNWYYYNGSNWESGGVYNSQSDVTNIIINDGSKLPTSKAVYDKFQDFIDLIYPIGSLYFSINSTNPSTYLGGNWIRYAEGKTIFGASDTDTDFTNEGTGGSKITAYAVGGPNGHSHLTGSETYPRSLVTNTTIRDLNVTTGGSTYVVPGVTDVSGSEFASTRYTDYDLGNHVEGYGSVFTAKNLPPYVSCYIWMRVPDNYSPVSTSGLLEYSIDNVYEPYQIRVESVANSIRQEKLASNKWIHVIFITDPHATDDPNVITNYNHSQAIAMYLAANAGIDKIILGGDYCVDNWTENKYRAYVSDFINAGFSDYIYPLSGNHERMLPKALTKDTAFPDSGFTAAQSRAILCNDFLLSKNNIVGNIQEGYYYIDDDERKVRYLFINTSDEAKYSVSSNQLRWIKKVGVAGKNQEWTLVVFGHINLVNVKLVNNETSDQVELRDGEQVELALREWSGKVAGYFCGHQHIDAHYTNNNINYVTLYCDFFSPSEEDADNKYKPHRPPQRSGNSSTDSAVTVISINVATRQVFLRRIGAGANTLNFGPDFEAQTYTYTYGLFV